MGVNSNPSLTFPLTPIEFDSQHLTLNPKRAQAFNAMMVKNHFMLLAQTITTHNIKPEKLYNVDEKVYNSMGGARICLPSLSFLRQLTSSMLCNLTPWYLLLSLKQLVLMVPLFHLFLFYQIGRAHV